MTTYGLTAEGFVVKPVRVIQDEIREKILSEVNAGFDLSDESPWGQLLGIFASHTGELWEVMGVVYDSRDPDNATKKSLYNVGALTGTYPRDPAHSTVLANVGVDAGTYAPGDLIASVAGDGDARFVNVDEVVNPGPSAAVIVGVRFTAESSGPIRANAGTLNVIAEAVTGWNSVTNPLDAEVGDNGETDEEFRIRRSDELSAAGSGTFEGLRADLLKMMRDQGFETIQVLVLFNDSDTVDGDGLPGHSFEAVVYDGSSDGSNISDEDIAKVVWESKPLGIEMFGGEDVDHVDSTGATRITHWSRPAVVEVWFEFDVKADPSLWQGVNSQTLAKQTVVDRGDLLVAGRDVVIRQFQSELIQKVPGLWDITATRVGNSASPVGTSNLVITARQLAVMDTARVLVNVTLEAPP